MSENKELSEKEQKEIVQKQMEEITPKLKEITDKLVDVFESFKLTPLQAIMIMNALTNAITQTVMIENSDIEAEVIGFR
jgi:uncharacterized protein YjcR